MPYLDGSLKRALAAGTTVVTPNRRLARALVALYDRGQRADGHGAWAAARALPWDAWLPTLWIEALAAGVVPDGASLRTSLQSAHAWNRIVADEDAPLIDPLAAARIAQEGWTLVHAWGAGGESWRAWADDRGTEDCATFARWASRYARDLRAANAIDTAELADRIGEWAKRMPSIREMRVALCGFVEFSPQQERLLAALASVGATITRDEALATTPGRIARDEGATPRDEIARAITWARTRALANPEAIIGVAVLDLAARLDEVQALADDILCPALQWPGADAAPRPYNLSLGKALAEAPLVAAALDLLDWAHRPLLLGRAAALLRSPWVATTPDAWLGRAELEAVWLREGRRTITMRAATTVVGAVDPLTAERWHAAQSSIRLPESATPREHADAWRTWLAKGGWPGARPLDSAEHQARQAFDEALASFAMLGAVEPRMSQASALGALRSHVETLVFQPETPDAGIQIVGVLEAAGQSFDALWVAGLAADRWPPAPRPNALLPVTWQRERNVPRSNAARELAYATALTAQFVRAAPEVVFSQACTDDDHPSAPSPLLPAGPQIDGGDLTQVASTAQLQFALRAPCEAVPDDAAPALPAGAAVSGGAGVIEAQSDCPFKAVAMFRLGTQTWPAPVDGLSPLERGVLVHAAMAAFWGMVERHDRLVSMSRETFREAVEQAAADAQAEFPPSRWRVMPPLIRAGEGARLAAIVRNWVDEFERSRPAFTRVETEAKLALELHGLHLRLRLDRIDTLEDGGVAIIDYKTGMVPPLTAWFAPRPQAPQLGLYVLAHEAAFPERRARAVAYAQLKPGNLALRGLAADPDAWPRLRDPATLHDAGIADWRGMEARWMDLLGGLCAEFIGGAAAVSPRNKKETCARCRRQALCRIGAPAIEDRRDDDDE